MSIKIGIGIGIPFRPESVYISQAKNYFNIVESEGGNVLDKSVVNAAIRNALKLNIFNKIELWISDTFGKILPNTLSPQALFVTTFDDAVLTEKTNVLPILQARNADFTSQITTSYIGASAGPYGAYMVWDDVVYLNNLNHDLECHSHTHPVSNLKTADELLTEMTTVNNLFLQYSINPPQHNAYPGGIFDVFVTQAYSKYRKTMRGIFSLGYMNYYKSVYFGQIAAGSEDGSFDSANPFVDKAASQTASCWIYSHGLTDGNKVGYATLLDYVIGKGVQIVTSKEWHRRLRQYRGHLFSVIQNDGFLINQFEYPFVKPKKIIFNTTLADITTVIADQFISDGYEVGFLDDITDAAHAYIIPNSSFRAAIRAINATFAGYTSISIGSGTFCNSTGDTTSNWDLTYRNGYQAYITSNKVFLNRYIDGVRTALGNYTFTENPETGMIVQLLISGGRVYVKIDDVTRLDIADDTYSNGNVMIGQGGLGVSGQNILNARLYLNQIDADGFTDVFADPAISETNYVLNKTWVRDCDAKAIFKTGEIEIWPGESVGPHISLSRNGAFTYLTVNFKRVGGRINTLRRMIMYYKNIDFSSKSISGTIQTCGLHYFKNTPVIKVHDNALTGIIPKEISELQLLTIFYGHTNQISDYGQGAFGLTQKGLTDIQLQNNLLIASAINQILIDVRDNVAIHKQAGTLNLGGTGNAAPTGDVGNPATGLGAMYQLQNAVAELGAAGNWTVTTN